MSVSTISTYLGIDTCKILPFGSIGAAYVAVGTASDYQGRFALLQNLTEGDMMFSDDPLDAVGKFPLKAGDKVLLDFTSNQTYGRGLLWPVGTILYVKQITAPVSGGVYLTIFYGN
jgi:hypothetical protein